MGQTTQGGDSAEAYTNASVYMQSGKLYSEGYEVINSSEWAENNSYTDASNYLRYPRYYEVVYEFNLMNGDVIEFTKPNPDDVEHGGCITIGEVLIEVK